MNLYFLSRTDYVGYDEYDSFVMCAESEEEARKFQPNGKEFTDELYQGSWTKNICDVHCVLIGAASEKVRKGVVIASFNAG